MSDECRAEGEHIAQLRRNVGALDDFGQRVNEIEKAALREVEVRRANYHNRLGGLGAVMEAQDLYEVAKRNRIAAFNERDAALAELQAALRKANEGETQ